MAVVWQPSTQISPLSVAAHITTRTEPHMPPHTEPYHSTKVSLACITPQTKPHALQYHTAKPNHTYFSRPLSTIYIVAYHQITVVQPYHCLAYSRSHLGGA